MVCAMEINQIFQNTTVWLDKHLYDEAERKYYEKLVKNTPNKVSLAGEVAKARERIQQSLENVDNIKISNESTSDILKEVADVRNEMNAVKLDVAELKQVLANIQKNLANLCISSTAATCSAPKSSDVCTKTSSSKPAVAGKDDDDLDIFGSDSEEEDEEAKKLKEQRLAEYAARKSKKPVLIAKSNIILDVKPWDDETDMKEMEKAVRDVSMDGLVWGASKLVPLAYGIHKLQISCVVEDDKVSVDELQEKLQDIEDYVQSVDIAAFNKV